jgi:hypothetical protein
MVSLVFGIAFVGIAAWWLISLYLDIRVPHLGWFAAGGLILFGLFGVFASLRGGESTPQANESPSRAHERGSLDEPTTRAGQFDEAPEPAQGPPPSP